jgi:hypothetical protein
VKFKPSSSAVVSAGDPELGALVSVEGVDGAAPPAKRTWFSLKLKDVSAAPAAAVPAVPAAAGAGAAGRRWRGPRCQRAPRTKQPPLVDGGVIERWMRNK